MSLFLDEDLEAAAAANAGTAFEDSVSASALTLNGTHVDSENTSSIWQERGSSEGNLSPDEPENEGDCNEQPALSDNEGTDAIEASAWVERFSSFQANDSMETLVRSLEALQAARADLLAGEGVTGEATQQRWFELWQRVMIRAVFASHQMVYCTNCEEDGGLCPPQSRCDYCAAVPTLNAIRRMHRLEP